MQSSKSKRPTSSNISKVHHKCHHITMPPHHCIRKVRLRIDRHTSFASGVNFRWHFQHALMYCDAQAPKNNLTGAVNAIPAPVLNRTTKCRYPTIFKWTNTIWQIVQNEIERRALSNPLARLSGGPSPGPAERPRSRAQSSQTLSVSEWTLFGNW